MDGYKRKCRTCFYGTLIFDNICSNRDCPSHKLKRLRPVQQQKQKFLPEIRYDGMESLGRMSVEVRDSTEESISQRQNVKALLLASPVEKRMARKRAIDDGKSKSGEKTILTFATPTRKIETAKSNSLLTLSKRKEFGLQTEQNGNLFVFPSTARTAIRCFNNEWMEADRNAELRNPSAVENQRIEASEDKNEPLPDVPQAPPAKNVKVDELTEVFKRLSAEDDPMVAPNDALDDPPGDLPKYYPYENNSCRLGIVSSSNQSIKKLTIPVSPVKTKTTVTTTIADDKRVTNQEITRELSLDPNIPPITTTIVVEVKDVNGSRAAVLPSSLDTSEISEIDDEEPLFCLICEMFVDQSHGESCRFFKKFVQAKPSSGSEFAKCGSCNGIFFAIANGSGEFTPKDHICVGPTVTNVVSALNFYYCLLCEKRFNTHASLTTHKGRHYHNYCVYIIQKIRGVYTFHPANMVIPEDLEFCCDFCQVFYFKNRKPSKCNTDFV